MITGADNKVRCEQRLGVTIAAIIMGPIFMLGPAVLGIALFVYAEFSWRSLAVDIGCLVASVFIAYHMLQNYQWVEFDGRVIRGKRFWTRKLVEQEFDSLRAIRPLQSVVQNGTTLMSDKILGDNRGWELKFNRGPSIVVIRHDMKDVDPMMRIVTEKLVQQNSSPDSRNLGV